MSTYPFTATLVAALLFTGLAFAVLFGVAAIFLRYAAAILQEAKVATRLADDRIAAALAAQDRRFTKERAQFHAAMYGNVRVHRALDPNRRAEPEPSDEPEEFTTPAAGLPHLAPIGVPETVPSHQAGLERFAVAPALDATFDAACAFNAGNPAPGEPGRFVPDEARGSASVPAERDGRGIF